MRIAVILITMCVLAACKHTPKPPAVVAQAVKKSHPKPKVHAPEEIPDIQYPESQLIAFMDSVKQLPTQALADKASHFADSIGEHFTVPLNRQFSASEFKLLQKAVKDSSIRFEDAERLFGKLDVSRDCSTKTLFDSVKKGRYIYSISHLDEIKKPLITLLLG